MENGSHVKCLATHFGRAWAQRTYGRGFTKKYLYGIVIGAAEGSDVKVKWEDDEETSAKPVHLVLCEEGDYEEAVAARRPPPPEPEGM